MYDNISFYVCSSLFRLGAEGSGVRRRWEQSGWALARGDWLLGRLVFVSVIVNETRGDEEYDARTAGEKDILAYRPSIVKVVGDVKIADGIICTSRLDSSHAAFGWTAYATYVRYTGDLCSGKSTRKTT